MFARFVNLGKLLLGSNQLNKAVARALELCKDQLAELARVHGIEDVDSLTLAHHAMGIHAISVFVSTISIDNGCSLRKAIKMVLPDVEDMIRSAIESSLNRAYQKERENLAAESAAEAVQAAYTETVANETEE